MIFKIPLLEDQGGFLLPKSPNLKSKERNNMGIYEELQARGLIAQVTDEERIRNLINNGEATFYIGFDCTADSLTAGHFMALTLMKRLQMAGNKPIALIGGGTTMIGDPSGRTDMRKDAHDGRHRAQRRLLQAPDGKLHRFLRRQGPHGQITPIGS